MAARTATHKMAEESPQVAESQKPLPKDMSHHYSDVTKARTPNRMKEYYKYFMIPGIGQFAGGLPNRRFFPFDTLEAQAAKPDRWTPTPNYPEDDAALSSQLAATSISHADKSRSDPSVASHITVPQIVGASDPLKKIDVASALQYGQANGYPPLLSFFREFSREYLYKNVPYRGGVEVILTNGATDGMHKAVEAFTNIWVPGKSDVREREGILTDIFTYPNVIGQTRPRGVQAVPVEMDDEGTAVDGPGGLEDVLGNWDYSKGKRPHLMYTVTMGHNPTSGVFSLERRREIYAVLSKYDIILIEDDPYWYLQYPSSAVEEARARGLPTPDVNAKESLPRNSGYAYLDSLVPSFLEIDTDGRVVRLDTFSKTVAPGCRLGYITAAPEIVERIQRIAEATTSAPSGFVQAIIAEALLGSDPANEAARSRFAGLRSARDRAAFSGWRMDGWVRWLAGLRGEYERRVQRVSTILERGAFQLRQSTPARPADADWGVISKTQLYDFRWPRGGMFLWLHMRFETHALWRAAGSRGNVIGGTELSTALMIFLTRKPFRVLVSPGMMFSATDEIRKERGWAYYRICFAAESEERVDQCAESLVQGVQTFWRIKNVHDLEDILDETAPQEFEEEEDEGLMDFGGMGC